MSVASLPDAVALELGAQGGAITNARVLAATGMRWAEFLASLAPSVRVKLAPGGHMVAWAPGGQLLACVHATVRVLVAAEPDGFLRAECLPARVAQALGQAQALTNARLRAEGLGDSWTEVLQATPGVRVERLEPRKPNLVVRLAGR